MHLEDLEGNKRLQVIRGDITRKDDVERAFDRAEVVIHLAVLGLRQSIKEPKRVNEVIVDGTLMCLDAAVQNKVELFLNCSSSEAYGSAVYVPMDEKHPLNPETPYAAAKVAQDMYVHSYGQTYDLPWTTIRPFNMYGPNSHWQGFRGEVIPKMIVRAMNRQPLIIFGDGSQTRDFIYVEDAAKAVVLVADNTACRGESINFCTGEEVSIRCIAELICDALDLAREEMIERQPPRPADVMRHLGDNTKFKTLLGFEPETRIEAGITRTVEWFQSLPLSAEELLSQEVLRAWE
jgi:UDP-glucose 4-epimerase